MFEWRAVARDAAAETAASESDAVQCDAGNTDGGGSEGVIVALAVVGALAALAAAAFGGRRLLTMKPSFAQRAQQTIVRAQPMTAPVAPTGTTTRGLEILGAPDVAAKANAPVGSSV